MKLLLDEMYPHVHRWPRMPGGLLRLSAALRERVERDAATPATAGLVEWL